MSDIRFVVGVDECGVGAMAGPLVVSAVAFAANTPRVETTWHGVRGDKTLAAIDSKKIKNPDHRAALSAKICEACASSATIERSPKEIDARLLRTVFPEAVQLAISRCLERLVFAHSDLSLQEVMVLVDGDIDRPDVPCPLRMIPGGDGLDWRIGAASVVAKARHDLRIRHLHEQHPALGLDKHRGYPTKAHKALLAQTGPVEGVHRMSYNPVRMARGSIPGFEE